MAPTLNQRYEKLLKKGFKSPQTTDEIRFSNYQIEDASEQLEATMEKEAEIFEWLDAHARRENTLLYLTEVYEIKLNN
jgi:hypothetical protein